MLPILKVDLNNHKIDHYLVPEEWEKIYLGGASLAARILYDRLLPDLDPLSPQAPLLFMNGPLSGTSGPAVGRFVVCGRSPATGLWGESNCGGFWGPELRKAGYDGLWIKGASSSPVYLWIQDDKVELRSAKHLWGKGTYQTQSIIENDLNVAKVRAVTIGIAGESKIPYALILCDHGRVAGRTGMGAVMGSKNLKAIAVRGTNEVPVANPNEYNKLRSNANRVLRSGNSATVLRELGTAGMAEYFDYLSEMPKHYFQHGNPIEDLRVSGAAMKDTILTGVSACHACVIACGRVVRLQDGEKRKGPEYETLVGFGPNLGINDAEFATLMGEFCDQYGMDVISMANTIGMAFRLYELGLIDENDTGGLELKWGSTEVVEALVHITAKREKFGANLAKGALALGRQFGAENEAVQVNNLEAPFHDPRGASGMALVYATSPRGACHNQSDYFLVDIGQIEASLGMEYFDRLDGAEKAENVKIHQDWITVFNALVMCRFANLEPETILELINSACGLDWEVEDLLISGERGWNLKRAINVRLGLTGENDKLPDAFTRLFADTPTGEEGFIPDFPAMLAAYYELRGWDAQTGFPSQKKLAELGMDWISEDLYLTTEGG